jgi:hypothetical protein
MLSRYKYRLRRLQVSAQIAWIESANRVRNRGVTGSASVVVSLTTHGSRLQSVHSVIESICFGEMRPARMILWLNAGPDTSILSRALLRLQVRGLEIRFVENYGPHTKYYPYVTSVRDHEYPLVTADDDVIYPPFWLSRLVAAYEAEPQYVHCYRARKIAMDVGRMAAYRQWDFDTTGHPSFLNFSTGVSGAVYPPALLTRLRQVGDQFRSCCPKADDIWLHAMGVRYGFRTKQLSHQAMHFQIVPGTDSSALYHQNMFCGGNDDQIAATYTETELQTLLAESDS